MKVISIQQPFAQLIALQKKSIETRSWDTKYRGPLAIHASKGFPKEYRELCLKSPFYEALMNAPNVKQNMNMDTQYLPLGCIVAVCDLVDVIPISDSPAFYTQFIDHLNPPGADLRQKARKEVWERETAFGDYTPGRYAWLLSNVRALSTPIPAKGSLGLWKFDASGGFPHE